MTLPDLPFVAAAEDDVELGVVDLGVARAFWEGVPTARLLARIRLHRDEHDLVDIEQRASGVDFDDASWDTVVASLLANAPTSLARLKRDVARHARSASDEGPLAAGDAAMASLVHALLSASDSDASPAEGADDAVRPEEAVGDASIAYDRRLGESASARRAAYYEACLELAKRASTSVMPLAALHAALGELTVPRADGARSATDLEPLVVSASELYPWSGKGEVATSERRACLLDRASLERALLHAPPRGSVGSREPARHRERTRSQVVVEVASCLARHGAVVLFTTTSSRADRDPPRLPPASWIPGAIDASGGAAALAAALEAGSVTGPRARSILMRGGEAALDAVAKEMLDVAAHPFASAVFAEVLATISRERDVVRLVTFFAIAPDPRVAAHALDLCRARDLVSSVLRAWLETILPTGAPEASTSGSRIDSYLDALRPYPALYLAVEPVVAPTPSTGIRL